MAQKETPPTPYTGDVALKIDGLCKTYRLWNNPLARLKAPILDRAGRLSGNVSMQERARGYYRDVHALKDISFEVKRGESVGIIGRNGSGKSTLLQAIAGTLRPTAGEVTVNGRVAALLELGSGFNPEFTGRENVYLNGAIQGLSVADIDECFDSIAEFADIGQYIEEPVKTYSSGMMMRLAFAVQTAVQPDILIVDEALSVGDTFFQNKCLARMRQMKDGGTTVLFVSHSSSVVKEMCDRGILLSKGTLVLDGNTVEVTERYFSMQFGRNPRSIAEKTVDISLDGDRGMSSGGKTGENRPIDQKYLEGQSRFEILSEFERVQDGRAHFQNVQVLSQYDVLCSSFSYGEKVTLRYVFKVDEPLNNVMVSYCIRTKSGVDIVWADSRPDDRLSRVYEAGATYLVDWTFSVTLQHGEYHIQAGIVRPSNAVSTEWEYIDVIPYAADFEVGSRKEGQIGGLVCWDSSMSMKKI